MSRKPPHDREPASEAEPQPGTAGPCESIDPMSLPEDPESAKPARGKPRPAPAPGVPMSAEEYERIGSAPGSLEEALDELENDHDFLLEGDVFTADVIHYWIKYKRENEVDAVRTRPHPYEFCMYFDI